MIAIAKDEGIPVREELIPRELLYVADELFFTGSASEITPIASVDRITIGSGRPGAMTRRLQENFFRIVRGETEDRRGWLALVDSRASAGGEASARAPRPAGATRAARTPSRTSS